MQYRETPPAYMLFAAVAHFVGDAPQHDDMAAIVFHLEDEGVAS